MSLESIKNKVDDVQLSGHLMEGVVADYCAEYGVDPAIFDGSMKVVAMKAVADVAMGAMLAALLEQNIDFDDLLLSMNFGERHPEISLMQLRLLQDHKEPFVLNIPRPAFDRRFKAMERWIKQAQAGA